MSNWAENAAINMIRLSRADNLKEAMREWGTTGGYDDSHSIEEVCELCEHEGLRYQFEIENRMTNAILWVGSTCVTRFVPLYENGIEILGESEKAQILTRRQKEFVNTTRQARAELIISQLAVKEPSVFKGGKWISEWELGYSAKQLMMLSAACRKHSILFNAYDFRINTRKQRVVNQIFELEPWQYRRLRAAFTSKRQIEFDAFFANK